MVHESPSWGGEPRSRHLLEVLVRDHPDSEPLLARALGDDDPLVVAHALLALEALGSDQLGDLPIGLAESRAKLTLRRGSFSIPTDLGSLARQVRKRHLARGGRAGSPA